MSTSRRLAAAGLAVALSACAHASAPTHHTTQSYLGGRAGQPQSWLASETPGNIQASPYSTAQLKGRNAQPYSWVESTGDHSSSMPATCAWGGRAAQPFSGPVQGSDAEGSRPAYCARDGVTRL
jgi:hypothetical protein